MSTDTIYTLLPESILLIVGVLIVVAGAFFTSTTARSAWSIVAAIGVLLAGAALYQQYESVFWADGAKTPIASVEVVGPIVNDLFGQYARWLTLACGLLFVVMASAVTRRYQPAEFYGSLLFSVAGVMLVAAAEDLVLIFMGLELVSIPTYIILYLGRSDTRSQEAAAKYFYLSILSSALLLYGFSFLYGATGASSLVDIRAFLSSADAGPGALLLARAALVLVFAGLGFRIAAVPFHFYAPDVYEGTTHVNAGFLAILPKIVGFVAIGRLLIVSMPGVETFGWRIALILAVLTMTIGNVLALWQRNIRRLLAYSSIAHAGYMLIGVAVSFATSEEGGDTSLSALDGLGAAILYLAIYSFSTIGAFAALVWLADDREPVETLDDIARAGTARPLAGLAMSVFMFSLAGIPPLAGFWGKFALFAGALSVDSQGPLASPLAGWFLGLAIVGVLNAAIAATYYLRVIGYMYFKPATRDLPRHKDWGAATATVACALITLAIGFFPTPLVTGASHASRSIRDPIARPVAQQEAPADAVAATSPGR